MSSAFHFSRPPKAAVKEEEQRSSVTTESLWQKRAAMPPMQLGDAAMEHAQDGSKPMRIITAPSSLHALHSTKSRQLPSAIDIGTAQPSTTSTLNLASMDMLSAVTPSFVLPSGTWHDDMLQDYVALESARLLTGNDGDQSAFPLTAATPPATSSSQDRPPLIKSTRSREASTAEAAVTPACPSEQTLDMPLPQQPAGLLMSQVEPMRHPVVVQARPSWPTLAGSPAVFAERQVYAESPRFIPIHPAPAASAGTQLYHPSPSLFPIRQTAVRYPTTAGTPALLGSPLLSMSQHEAVPVYPALVHPRTAHLQCVNGSETVVDGSLAVLGPNMMSPYFSPVPAVHQPMSDLTLVSPELREEEGQEEGLTSPGGATRKALSSSSARRMNLFAGRRRQLSTEEVSMLTEIFRRCDKPNAQLRSQLANQMGMTPRAVQIWFQNKRAKRKKDIIEKGSSSLSSPPLQAETPLLSSPLSLPWTGPDSPAGTDAPVMRPIVLRLDQQEATTLQEQCDQLERYCQAAALAGLSSRNVTASRAIPTTLRHASSATVPSPVAAVEPAQDVFSTVSPVLIGRPLPLYPIPPPHIQAQIQEHRRRQQQQQLQHLQRRYSMQSETSSHPVAARAVPLTTPVMLASPSLLPFAGLEISAHPLDEHQTSNEPSPEQYAQSPQLAQNMLGLTHLQMPQHTAPAETFARPACPVVKMTPPKSRRDVVAPPYSGHVRKLSLPIVQSKVADPNRRPSIGPTVIRQPYQHTHVTMLSPPAEEDGAVPKQPMPVAPTRVSTAGILTPTHESALSEHENLPQTKVATTLLGESEDKLLPTHAMGNTTDWTIQDSAGEGERALQDIFDNFLMGTDTFTNTA